MRHMRHKQNISALLLGTLFVVASVSGCAGPAETSAISPSASQTPSQTPIATKTAEQASIDFAEIAKQSCFRAQKLGVVEAGTYSGKEIRTVMVPKSEAYLDFNAAYYQAPDSYELIWEITGLYSCGAYFTFSMAEEAGQPANIQVSFDGTDSTYSTVEDVGEAGISKIKYSIVDGFISSVQSSIDANKIETSVTYGNLSASDIQIIKTAVDRYNKTLD